MKKIVIVFVSAIFAVFAVMSMAYSRDNVVVVVLEPASILGNHSSEPVPADCFVDPQTGEVEVVRTDGEGDLYVTVFEESIPVASTVVDAEDDEGSVFVTGASGDMTVNVTTETGGEFEGFFYL